MERGVPFPYASIFILKKENKILEVSYIHYNI